MFSNKSNNKIGKFIVSDDGVLFIKKFVLPNMDITSPIDADILDEIVDLAVQWELDMIDPSSESGSDKQYDYPEKSRNEMACNFVSEITGKWDDDKLIPDFENLNKRLGLI